MSRAGFFFVPPVLFCTCIEFISVKTLKNLGSQRPGMTQLHISMSSALLGGPCPYSSTAGTAYTGTDAASGVEERGSKDMAHLFPLQQHIPLGANESHTHTWRDFSHSLSPFM